MKFLHTADWHVGKTLKGRNRLDEQRAVLAQISRIATDNQVDAVLVAGDLYDTSAPSADAQRLVNATLLGLARDGIEVVVIAGNHDHGRTFEALRELMSAAGITYAGQVRAASAQGVHNFTASSTGEPVVVALVPFLTRRAIIGAEEIVTGDVSENVGKYEASVRTIMSELAGAFSEDSVNIVMAHLTMTGGIMGGGEREAQSVLEYHVSPDVFPAGASYVALGHLHKRQRIRAGVPVHYAGSPLAVDFGEQAYDPVVCLVDVAPGRRAQVTDVPVTAGRKLRTITGTADQVRAAAADCGDDYLRVVLREAARAGTKDLIMDALPNTLEIRIHPDFQEVPQQRRLSVTSRSAHDLFADYCRDAHIDDPRVVALFDQLFEESLR